MVPLSFKCDRFQFLFFGVAREREGGELGWSIQGNRDDFTDIARGGREYCDLFAERGEFESKKVLQKVFDSDNLSGRGYCDLYID